MEGLNSFRIELDRLRKGSFWDQRSGFVRSADFAEAKMAHYYYPVLGFGHRGYSVKHCVAPLSRLSSVVCPTMIG